MRAMTADDKETRKFFITMQGIGADKPEKSGMSRETRAGTQSHSVQTTCSHKVQRFAIHPSHLFL